MRLYRTSVKDDLNVGSVFQHLAENYVNKVSLIMCQFAFGMIERKWFDNINWLWARAGLVFLSTFIRKGENGNFKLILCQKVDLNREFV